MSHQKKEDASCDEEKERPYNWNEQYKHYSNKKDEYYVGEKGGYNYEEWNLSRRDEYFENDRKKMKYEGNKFNDWEGGYNKKNRNEWRRSNDDHWENKKEFDFKPVRHKDNYNNYRGQFDYNKKQGYNREWNNNRYTYEKRKSPTYWHEGRHVNRETSFEENNSLTKQDSEYYSREPLFEENNSLTKQDSEYYSREPLFEENNSLTKQDSEYYYNNNVAAVSEDLMSGECKDHFLDKQYEDNTTEESCISYNVNIPDNSLVQIIKFFEEQKPAPKDDVFKDSFSLVNTFAEDIKVENDTQYNEIVDETQSKVILHTKEVTEPKVDNSEVIETKVDKRRTKVIVKTTEVAELKKDDLKLKKKIKAKKEAKTIKIKVSEKKQKAHLKSTRKSLNNEEIESNPSLIVDDSFLGIKSITSTLDDIGSTPGIKVNDDVTKSKIFKLKIDKKKRSALKIETDTVVEEGEEIIGLNNTDKLPEDIPDILKDKRYKIFLQHTVPHAYKDYREALKYLNDNNVYIREKAIMNRAEIPDLIKDVPKAPLNVVNGIKPLTLEKWSEEDEKIFRNCVLKYKNDFKTIKNEIPHIETNKCILKYYLTKNKTYSYIKRRPGRMSDTEIKLIVENEWTPHEINIFIKQYKILGKNWTKYQPYLNKSEKDLKIFLRYYTKFMSNYSKKKLQLIPSPQSKKKNSISKQDILNKWTIDERQIFAIYFPYYNKNWITMATYIPSKTSVELKQYYNKYFKHLTYNEQRFEASLHDFGGSYRTPPVAHVGNSKEEMEFCSGAGLLFKK